MKPEDLIYNHTFKDFINQGFTDRDAGEVAASAIRNWKRGNRHKDAIDKAIKEGKKLYKKVK